MNRLLMLAGACYEPSRRGGTPGFNEIHHRVTQLLGPLDQTPIRGLVQLRGPGQNPKESTIRSTHHRNPILRLELENPIVPLVG
jgi:hypothetical protein